MNGKKDDSLININLDATSSNGFDCIVHSFVLSYLQYVVCKVTEPKQKRKKIS